MNENKNKSGSTVVKTEVSKVKNNSKESVNVQSRIGIRKVLPDTNISLHPALYSYCDIEYLVPEGIENGFSISGLNIYTKRTCLDLMTFEKCIYDRKPVFPNLKIKIDGVKRSKKNLEDMLVGLYKKGTAEPLIQEVVREEKGQIAIDWTYKVKELEPGGYFLWLRETNTMLGPMLGWAIGEDLKVDFEVLQDGAELEQPEITTISWKKGNSASFLENPVLWEPNFVITLEKPLGDGRIISTCCFNEDLYQMTEEVSEAYLVSKSVLNIRLLATDVWMPGTYDVLLFQNRDPFAKFSFSIDGDGVRMGVPEPIDRYDKNYMIGRYLSVYNPNWDRLSHSSSSAGLRKGIVANLDSIGFNKIRLPYLLSNMYENLNYLIECRDDDDTCQMIDVFCDLIANARSTGTFDCRECSEKYAQDRKNAVIDEYFELEETDSIYYLKNAGSLLQSGGEYMMSKIMRGLSNRKMNFVLACRKGEGDRLFDAYPALKSYFPESHRISMIDYTTSAIVFEIRAIAVGTGMGINQEAVYKIAQAVVEAEKKGTLIGWGQEQITNYVYDTLFSNFRKRKLAARKNEQETVCGCIEEGDIDTDVFTDCTGSFEDAMAGLNAMIGLGKVKHSFESVMNTLRMFQLRKTFGLKSGNETSYHMLFTGNPGTGKTTVAKMIGKIFKSLGLLSKGDVIVADRARMVGQWIGETERKMAELLVQARGNVLFIDEAYSLCNGGNTDRRDFGYRVIECLMPVMALNNSDILVIMAGYPKEMDILMDGNAGLKGRFPYRFNFDDYTAEELIWIGKNVLENNDYLLTKDAEQRFCRLIENAVKARDRNFSNARWVEQFIRNGIFPAMAERVIREHECLDKDYYRTIELADIEAAYLTEKEKSIALSGRLPVGFSQ